MAKKAFILEKKGLLDNTNNQNQESIVEIHNNAEELLEGRAYEDIETGISHFTQDNAPKTYEGLKNQVKFLERIHAQTFLIMAHRLKIIRDQELYKEDGYNDFKSFVENELDIARRTVYNYITVLENWGVQTSAHDLSVNNLLALVPYLKEYPEKREDFLELAGKLSYRSLRKHMQDNFPLKTLLIEQNKKENSESGDWLTNEQDLISHSKVIREGMKIDTVKRDAKDFINLLLIKDPKNKALQKIRDLWTDV